MVGQGRDPVPPRWVSSEGYREVQELGHVSWGLSVIIGHASCPGPLL